MRMSGKHYLFINMLERFTDNFHELEQSLADKVSVSKQRLKEWRIESRDLLKQLAEMRSLPSLDAGAGA